MSQEDQLHRRMQVKVLYSFDNSPTVFLTRSKQQFSVKVAQIPIESLEETDQVLTLGAFEIKNCVQQVVRSSPENFRLQTEDYAVYYKDVTEQPDEPFVSNGVMSSLLASPKPDLIPGRVCQNLSASFLFGDKANASSLTLEIRLKFHVIEINQDQAIFKENEAEAASKCNTLLTSLPHSMSSKRKRAQASASVSAAASSSGATKATRTKSLPIFYHPPSQLISNIINADKLNAAPKYDSKSILERFNLAPFLLAKIIDKPSRKKRRQNIPLTPTVQASSNASQPQRAVRTRSMFSNYQPTSSPINEDAFSEATDDTDYNDNSRPIDEEDEEDDDYDDLQGDSSSPYTPQQPPYKQSQSEMQSSINIVSSDRHHFHSLPDLEELDSKKTHTIPSTRLPSDHDLICINGNCAAADSVTWRYFETKFQTNYLNILRSKQFDKSLYDGMFGPLCNACYLFLRNKGFMRPEAVVKKYLQQQKYKKELKMRENFSGSTLSANRFSSPIIDGMSKFHKFATPSHVPSAINAVIQHQNGTKGRTSKAETPNSAFDQTPNGQDYLDLNDFMAELNNFGGPLTDMDIPYDSNQGFTGNTPPMIATKSNTRVINIPASDEDKENCPPAKYDNVEQMMIRSYSLKSSPEKQDDWAQLFGEPTPKDNTTPHNMPYSVTPGADASILKSRKFMVSPVREEHEPTKVSNMPSSPFLATYGPKENAASCEGSSPLHAARRADTTMSYVRASSPYTEPLQEEKV